LAQEIAGKDMDALLVSSKEKVLDNAAIGAILRNFGERLKRLEAKREPKAKAAAKSASE
jgi:hypothetical protein